MKVGILHTSFVFVNVDPVLRELVNEHIPEAQVIDFVDGDVLAQVRRDGFVTESSSDRMKHLAQAAESAGVDIIFWACSSLGPAVERARSAVNVEIVRIDEAMAAEAVRLGNRIGVLATVPTTIGPTTEILREHADRRAKIVTIAERLCEGAFDLLMSGDREGHDALVFAGASDLAQDADVIVLAQASMARLAEPLSERLGLRVLASPRLGVEELARRVRAKAGLAQVGTSQARAS
jgi:Asp/Glu/hydantoin racemase